MNMNLDMQLNSWLISIRNPVMTNIMLGMSFVGNKFSMTILVLVFVGLLVLWKKKKSIVPFLVAVIGSTLTFTLIKLLVHRMRPAQAVYLEPSFSFPSGHTTVAVVVFGFIAYIFAQKSPTKLMKKTWIIICGFFAVLIGFSRLYLGVHYLSDVLAGGTLGAVWLWLGIRLDKK